MNKVYLLICLFVFSVSAMAKTVAWVTEVKGNAFIVLENKNLKMLKLGSQIEDLSTVMVEDGSSLSVLNNKGHEFYITTGSYVKFFNGITELISGNVWVVAKESKGRGEFFTANSNILFDQGQFILSYDSVAGRTQVLGLEGSLKFSNSNEVNLKVNVPAGHFSFVDNEYEKSLPRTPKRVGNKSHSRFKDLFASFEHLRNADVHSRHWAASKKKKKQLRSIASVDDQFSMSRPTGKILKVKTYMSTRKPASISPMEDYTKMKRKSQNKYRPQKTKKVIKIKYHGFEWKEHKSSIKDAPTTSQNIKPKQVKKVNRVPASVMSNKQKLLNELSRTPDSPFESSLQGKIQEQKRHPSEVNQLIDEFKSMGQEYNKNY